MISLIDQVTLALAFGYLKRLQGLKVVDSGLEHEQWLVGQIPFFGWANDYPRQFATMVLGKFFPPVGRAEFPPMAWAEFNLLATVIIFSNIMEPLLKITVN